MTSYIDDEYQLAGVDDPRILITTSRNPTARLKQFAKVCYKICLLVRLADLLHLVLCCFSFVHYQLFDILNTVAAEFAFHAVGWASGRASGL